MRKEFLLIIIFISIFFSANAQDSVTVKDYERAQKFLSTFSLVDNSSINAVWVNGDQFWYTEKERGVTNYFLVDGKKKTRKTAFDKNKLAAALSKETDKSITGDKLNISGVSFSDDVKTMFFRHSGKSWKYIIASGNLSQEEKIPESASAPAQSGRFFGGSSTLSPDGTMRAFIKDYNLWVRDVKDDKEYQLTTDGVKDYGYATDNAGWKHTNNAIVKWSGDSKMIATFQQDERNVGDMYLVTTNVGHPRLESWKYPLPGDSIVAMVERVFIKVDKNNPEVIRLKIPADYHRATLGDDISTGDMQWSADNRTFAFVSTSRDHKQAKLRIADAATGNVRDVFEETVATQFESGQSSISWRYLSATNEIIWYSERDNWGHLYLYNAQTGNLKNQITKGNFVVSSIVKIDEKNRLIYFYAAGLDKKNPYFQHFCVINFNGAGFKDQTPEEGTHNVSFSPSGSYFINTWSQPDIAPSFNLRNIKGDRVVELGRADISRLEEIGWKPAMPFSVKAADGVTDVYGLMFTPTNLVAGKKYPIVNYIYPGPQGGSIGNWGFSPSRGDHQALAELGFVVVLIEGTGNPMRSKSFHDMSYPEMSTNTLPDQIAGIKQLAERFDFIDTSRVGIWGHSGGGFATADAMFTYPDFYKVGISESGNHDNRNYEDDWGERYIGLLEKNADGTSNYTHQANQVHAKNLKGKLLIVHGLMDDNVPPYNTLLVVKALQDANKDFDLIIFPDSRHGFGQYSTYMMRVRWDYFVKNLKGALHPKEFKINISR